jgi:hypothetical protein
VTRPTFVYRIEVVFPTDPVTGEVLCPNDAGGMGEEYEDGSVPRWPRVRQFLAPGQAQKRANLLLERGAVSAVVVRSLPVGWPE